MTERYIEGRWVEEFAMDGLRWIPAGVYDDATLPERYPEGSVFIPREAASRLVTFLDETGRLKPRLDERLRVEDLKITHRLIDLLDKVATNGSPS